MTSDNKKVCVPIEERELNEVDKLEEEIKRIQDNCDHDFRLLKKPELRESLVGGVFVGYLAGPAKVLPFELKMMLVCLKCSKRKEASIMKMCPRCLHLMGKERCLGAGSRERYFGNRHSYYSAALSQCPNCGFTIASDEWDQ